MLQNRYELPNTPACRRFEQVPACFRIGTSCPKHLPAHVLSSAKTRAAFGSSPLRGPADAASSEPGVRAPGFTSPKSLARVLKFLFYTGAHVSGCVFSSPNRPKHLPADVLDGFQRKRDFTETHLEKRLKPSAGRRFGYKHPTRRVGFF